MMPNESFGLFTRLSATCDAREQAHLREVFDHFALRPKAEFERFEHRVERAEQRVTEREEELGQADERIAEMEADISRIDDLEGAAARLAEIEAVIGDDEPAAQRLKDIADLACEIIRHLDGDRSAMDARLVAGNLRLALRDAGYNVSLSIAA